jgi:hypothetical protein
MAGAVQGNSPFQAVWLSDAERDAALRTVQKREMRLNPDYKRPIAFEGNAPADLRDNQVFAGLVARSDAASAQPEEAIRVWLGAPNSIKEPTHATFRNRSGNNLLIVGQREDTVLALISTSLLSISAAASKAGRIFLLDSTAPGSGAREQLQRIIRALPNEVISANEDLAEAINTLAGELASRVERLDSAAPAIFFIIQGLQNFKKLRPEEEFSFSADPDAAPNPASQFAKIFTEGPSHGIHVIASVDTYNNVNRFLGRKGLSEFEMRVLFQMSANDSASLCDDPRASQLGLYRALFYNEQEGVLETFRPYGAPDAAWVNALFQNAASRLIGSR